MRITFLADRIPPYEIGGGGKIPWHLAQGFRELGHDVAVISSTPDASFEEIRNDISIYYLHSAYPDRWRAWVSLYNPAILGPLKSLLAHLKPEVVNAHNIHTHLSYASLRLANQMGLPVVFSSHDVMPFAYGKIDYFIQPTGCDIQSQEYRLPFAHNIREMRFRYNPLRNVTIRAILSRYTHQRTAVSQAHRQALEANGLSAFEVVYHGFDASSSVDPSLLAALRGRFGLTGRKVILVGGRLSIAKGSRQLLLALNQVVRTIPDVTLLMLSKAPLEPELWSDLPHLTRQHICEAGWLSGQELGAAFQLADIICVPSIYLDPQPTVTYEAMANAKPTIVTCFGGAPELVQHGKTGYVVNPFDTATFADHLHHLLINPDDAKQMGQAAFAHLQSHYTKGHHLQHMMGLYQIAQQLASQE